MDLTTQLPDGTPPCPDGRPQRLCELLGFRPKSVDLLQLRVVLRGSDGGVCHATVEEHSDRVCVRAVACLDDEPSFYLPRPPGDLWPPPVPPNPPDPRSPQS